MLPELVSIPERITPWLILVSATIGALGALGGGYYWVKRKLTVAFVEAVNEVVSPLVSSIEQVVEEQAEVRLQLGRTTRERKREVDKQFVEVQSSIKMLEARIAKSQETAT